MIKLMMMTMKKKSDEMCRTAGLYIPSFLSNRYKSASSPCHDSNDDDMMMMTIMVIMLMMIMMSKLYNRYKVCQLSPGHDSNDDFAVDTRHTSAYVTRIV